MKLDKPMVSKGNDAQDEGKEVGLVDSMAFCKWRKPPESKYSIKAINESSRQIQAKGSPPKFFQSDKERDAFIQNRFEETKLVKKLDHFDFAQEIVRKSFQQEARLVKNRQSKLHKRPSLSLPSLTTLCNYGAAWVVSESVGEELPPTDEDKGRAGGEHERPKSVPAVALVGEGESKRSRQRRASESPDGRRKSSSKPIAVSNKKNNEKKLKLFRRCSISNFDKFISEIDLSEYIEEEEQKDKQTKDRVDRKRQGTCGRRTKSQGESRQDRRRFKPGVVHATSDSDIARRDNSVSGRKFDGGGKVTDAPLETLIEEADDEDSDEFADDQKALPPSASSDVRHDGEIRSAPSSPVSRNLLLGNRTQSAIEFFGKNHKRGSSPRLRTVAQSTGCGGRKGVVSFQVCSRKTRDKEVRTTSERQKTTEEQRPRPRLDRIQRLVQEKERLLEQQTKVDRFVESLRRMSFRSVHPIFG